MTDVFLQIKRSLDIINVAKDLGMNVGKNNKALSPFSNEKTPSFQLYPDTQSFNCFSTNQGGTVIDLVMKFYNISLYESAKFLNEKYHLGIDLEKGCCSLQNDEIIRKRQLDEAIHTYKRKTMSLLCEMIRTFRGWVRDYSPINSYDMPCDKLILATTCIERLDFLSKLLCQCQGNKIIEFYNDYESEVKAIADKYRNEIYFGQSKRRGA